MTEPVTYVYFLKPDEILEPFKDLKGNFYFTKSMQERMSLFTLPECFVYPIYNFCFTEFASRGMQVMFVL